MCNPTNTPNQMGALERHVALLKLPLVKIRLRDSSLSFSESVRMACLARNNSMILGSGRTPSSIVFGKSDYFYPLENGIVSPDETLSPEEARANRHLIGVSLARSEIMKLGAQYTARTCLQRDLRPGGKTVPLIGSAIDIGVGQEWHSGWRTVGMLAPNVICERDGQFRKCPFAKYVLQKKRYGCLTNGMEKLRSSLPDQVRYAPQRKRRRCFLPRILFLPWGQMVDNCWNNTTNAVRGRSRHLFFGSSSISSMTQYANENTYPAFSGVLGSSLQECVVSHPDEEHFGPSRLTHKEYLSSKDCRDAIAREMDGLPSKDKSGFDPLIIIDRSQEPYRHRPVVKSTLVVRWKIPTKAKERLCIRGDMLPVRDQVSAPTPPRSDVKTFLFLAMSCNMRIAQIDISQAFLQEDVMRDKDQLVAGPPECIELLWQGTVLGEIPRPRRYSPWALLLRKPLYGLRESPLRWFFAYKQMSPATRLSTEQRRYLSFRSIAAELFSGNGAALRR